MNRTEVRHQIKKALGETTSAFWDDTEFNSRINEAAIDISWKTKCLKTSGLLTTVSGQSEYGLLNNFPEINAIQGVYLYSDGTTWVKLRPTTLVDLDNVHQGWKSAASSTPTEYAWSIEEDLLILYPPPNATNAGAYLKVYYSYNAGAIPADDDTDIYDLINIPPILHIALVHYVTSVSWKQRGEYDRAKYSLDEYSSSLRDYVIEREREREDDRLIAKNYRNI